MARAFSIFLFFCCVPAWGVTNVVMQYFQTGNNSNEFSLATTFTAHVPLARPATAGDTLIWCMNYSAGTGWAVKAGSETFTEGVHGTDSGVGSLDCYYYVNIAGGETSLSVTHTSGSPLYFGGAGYEVNNITAHHVAGTCTTASGALGQAAGTTVTSGTTGTLTSGDWLSVYTFQFGSPQLSANYVPVTHANVTWQLIDSQLLTAQAFMVGQYSATTAFQPSMTQGSVQTSNMCTDAFTTGTSGATGLPTGEFIAGEQSETFLSGDNNPFTLEITPIGNTVVMVNNTGYGGNTTSVSSSPSATWTITPRCYDSGDNTEVSDWFATGLTPETTYTVTVTLNSAGPDGTISEFDIGNGSTPNVGSAGACNSGIFSATSGNLNTSLTTGGGAATNTAFVPTSANGIVISGDSVEFDTNSGTTTSGATVNMGYFSGATQTANTPYYENDGDLTYTHSTTSGIAFIYTITASPPNTSSDVSSWSSQNIDVPAGSAPTVVRHRGWVIQ